MRTTIQSGPSLASMVAAILVIVGLVLALAFVLTNSDRMNPTAAEARRAEAQQRLDHTQELHEQKMAQRDQDHNLRMDLMERCLPWVLAGLAGGLFLGLAGLGCGAGYYLYCRGRIAMINEERKRLVPPPSAGPKPHLSEEFFDPERVRMR